MNALRLFLVSSALTAFSPSLLAQKASAATNITLNIGGSTLNATLTDSATTRAFLSLLPLTLTLENHGGTEKITYLPRKLSTTGAPAGSTPTAGTIAYYTPWGNLALFYKEFSYSAGLIVLGKLGSGLEILRQPGKVKVTITQRQ
ncbi:cyclophilin-like fold protein [Deinococcus oregonensis]|uniref:Cyclophilin-like fold protein n=1 Tax=Deinococcus oregonensis TaxID=1805970 RepID=A0ABV6B282_9DEIO